MYALYIHRSPNFHQVPCRPPPPKSPRMSTLHMLFRVGPERLTYDDVRLPVLTLGAFLNCCFYYVMQLTSAPSAAPTGSAVTLGPSAAPTTAGATAAPTMFTERVASASRVTGILQVQFSKTSCVHLPVGKPQRLQ